MYNNNNCACGLLWTKLLILYFTSVRVHHSLDHNGSRFFFGMLFILVNRSPSKSHKMKKNRFCNIKTLRFAHCAPISDSNRFHFCSHLVSILLFTFYTTSYGTIYYGFRHSLHNSVSYSKCSYVHSLANMNCAVLDTRYTHEIIDKFTIVGIQHKQKLIIIYKVTHFRTIENRSVK